MGLSNYIMYQKPVIHILAILTLFLIPSIKANALVHGNVVDPDSMADLLCNDPSNGVYRYFINDQSTSYGNDTCSDYDGTTSWIDNGFDSNENYYLVEYANGASFSCSGETYENCIDGLGGDLVDTTQLNFVRINEPTRVYINNNGDGQPVWITPDVEDVGQIAYNYIVVWNYDNGNEQCSTSLPYGSTPINRVDILIPNCIGEDARYVVYFISVHVGAPTYNGYAYSSSTAPRAYFGVSNHSYVPFESLNNNPFGDPTGNIFQPSIGTTTDTESYVNAFINGTVSTTTTATLCDSFYQATSTTFASSIITSLTGGGCRLLVYMFIPNTNTIGGVLQTFKTQTFLKPPWGYITLIISSYNSTSTNATSTLPNLSFTLPTGYPGAGKIINLTPWDKLMGPATILSTAENPNTGDTLFEILSSGWSIFVYSLMIILLGFEVLGINVTNYESNNAHPGKHRVK